MFNCFSQNDTKRCETFFVVSGRQTLPDFRIAELDSKAQSCVDCVSENAGSYEEH